MPWEITEGTSSHAGAVFTSGVVSYFFRYSTP
jgi:hypothetical protein